MKGALHAGALITGGLTILCLIGPWIASHDPNQQLDPAVSKLQPPGAKLWVVEIEGQSSSSLAERVEWRGDQLVLYNKGATQSFARDSVLNANDSGVAEHRRYLLGSDQFGRDLWSRLLAGGRVTLAVALTAGLLSLSIGVAVGALRALGPRWLDSLLERVTDTLLAFPDLILVVLLAALFRPGLVLLIAFVGTTSWMGLSRIVRGEILALAKRDWVTAARALGQSETRLFFRHLLPNITGPILVDASLRIGGIVLLEAALSFLGFGVQPPNPSWGTLIADGRAHLATAWWISAFPGIAITITVLGLFLLSDGLAERFSPKRRLASASTPFRPESFVDKRRNGKQAREKQVGEAQP